LRARVERVERSGTHVDDLSLSLSLSRREGRNVDDDAGDERLQKKVPPVHAPRGKGSRFRVLGFGGSGFRVWG